MRIDFVNESEYHMKVSTNPRYGLRGNWVGSDVQIKLIEKTPGKTTLNVSSRTKGSEIFFIADAIELNPDNKKNVKNIIYATQNHLEKKYFKNKTHETKNGFIVCPKCTKPNDLNSKFCQECGIPLQKIVNKEKIIKTSKKSPLPKPRSLKPRRRSEEHTTTKTIDINDLEYLEKLAGLRDKSIISDEEFEKKKKDILKL